MARRWRLRPIGRRRVLSHWLFVELTFFTGTIGINIGGTNDFIPFLRYAFESDGLCRKEAQPRTKPVRPIPVLVPAAAFERRDRHAGGNTGRQGGCSCPSSAYISKADWRARSDQGPSTASLRAHRIRRACIRERRHHQSCRSFLQGLVERSAKGEDGHFPCQLRRKYPHN
jgi:hypothetical protein